MYILPSLEVGQILYVQFGQLWNNIEELAEKYHPSWRFYQKIVFWFKILNKFLYHPIISLLIIILAHQVSDIRYVSQELEIIPESYSRKNNKVWFILNILWYKFKKVIKCRSGRVFLWIIVNHQVCVSVTVLFLNNVTRIKEKTIKISNILKFCENMSTKSKMLQKDLPEGYFWEET